MPLRHNTVLNLSVLALFAPQWPSRFVALGRMLMEGRGLDFSRSLGKISARPVPNTRGRSMPSWVSVSLFALVAGATANHLGIDPEH
jgi:hypothetical protein